MQSTRISNRQLRGKTGFVMSDSGVNDAIRPSCCAKKDNSDNEISHESLQGVDGTTDSMDALPSVHEQAWRVLVQALVLAIQEQEMGAGQAIQVVVLHLP